MKEVLHNTYIRFTWTSNTNPSMLFKCRNVSSQYTMLVASQMTPNIVLFLCLTTFKILANITRRLTTWAQAIMNM